ncbi:glycerophosphoryl diester phosphodiesterase [Desulfobaculum xiamenense]|uniref:Glycerophosphoryl diester phosphodiesterase n=1 Tax=Desulfobaculum xiamenense TaxID=995050 RepID=A0A846QI52_9BACT|nr:glycerophosphodiester phosphodiesterase family protein [Desulfobaculum xiamenense]NJB67928.1 glycerophosphoryl diester phosphodiesterase [Desulfobaculum xiamenense]
MFFSFRTREAWPLVCAHRGARSIAPENTLAAAKAGLAAGADFWELDVQMTADGELVVHHDDELTRTTDAAVRAELTHLAPYRADALALNEIRQLDAGSWFVDRDPYGTIATGEVEAPDALRGVHVPTLREALIFSRDNAFPVNIEIKDHAGRPGDATVTDKIIDCVRELGMPRMVLLSSFNHGYLRRARELAPEIPRGVLVEGSLPEAPVRYAADLGAAAFHPDHTLLVPILVSAFRAAGIAVNTWTVNGEDRAEELAAMGVNALITDWPQRFVPYLQGWEGTPS